MANIKKHLDNIKGALYGKDVRGSIHDGIDAINKEVENTTGRQVDLEKTFDQLVINAGNSNAEIVDARVKSDGTSYSKLGDRLDEVDSQLEHKANLGDLNLHTNNNLQYLIDDCVSKNKNLTLNANIDYVIDKKLTVRGSIKINGNGCKITNNSSDYTFEILGDYNDVEISNLNIVGGNTNSMGIITNVVLTKLYNINFLDINNIINVTGKYEVVAEKIFATSSNKRLLENAIIVKGTDCHFTDIILKNFRIPITTYSGGNIFTRVHPWLETTVDNSNSICIDSYGGNNKFVNCCLDGYRTIIKTQENWSNFILDNCHVLYSIYTWGSVSYGADFLVNNGVSYPSILVTNTEIYGPNNGLEINTSGWDLTYGDGNIYKSGVNGRFENKFNLTFDANFKNIDSYLIKKTDVDLSIECSYLDSTVSGWSNIVYLGYSPKTDKYLTGVIVDSEGNASLIPIRIIANEYKVQGFFSNPKGLSCKIYIYYSFNS